MPALVLSLIGLGAGGVLVLWWRSTDMLGSTGQLLTGAGDALGLLAAYGFVMLVALMARLPPLERGIGADRLARWHAMGGRYVITLVTGHVVLTIWGYAVTAHEKVTRETVTLLISYPDVLMATVSWFLLLGVAAFSMRAARRRLSYETWYYAHLYTYLAIALAFSHQFADGPAFAANRDARVAWSALYVAVAALIAWFRILTPLRNAARYRFTVQSVRPEAPGIVSVFIAGRGFDRLGAEPGQFFRWRFLTRELWWQSHPYSLSAMPQPNLMRITVKARGDHSGSLASLKSGTRIIAEGPYGAFTPAVTGRRVLLIAGGVGITPIRAMFASLPKRMQADGITLLYRASHPRDVVFSRELDAIAADRDAALHYLIGSREELGFDPLDTDHLQAAVPGLHRCEAYVCGPAGMTEAAVKSLADAGIPRRRIHRESFSTSNQLLYLPGGFLMRRALLTLGGTAAGLAALLSFRTHSLATAFPAPASPPSASAMTSQPMANGAGSSSASPAASKKASAGRMAGASSPASSRTVTGTAANTPYGPMQVQLTLSGTKITKVTVLQRTNDGVESDQIDNTAIPTLTGETLAAQSAHIDAVSGATYTSSGYIQSLQSALDRAGG